MNNIIYIIWNIKYCKSEIYKIKLGDLTPDECYLWFSIHTKYLHDNISEVERETILKFQLEIKSDLRYVKFVYQNLSDFMKIDKLDTDFAFLSKCDQGLFILTGD